MYRLIVILVLLIILFFMVRKGIREFLGWGKPDPMLPGKDVMVQDPVCKLYVTAEAAVVKKIGDQTYYFCSDECAFKFKDYLSG